MFFNSFSVLVVFNYFSVFFNCFCNFGYNISCEGLKGVANELIVRQKETNIHLVRESFKGKNGMNDGNGKKGWVGSHIQSKPRTRFPLPHIR